MVGSQGFACPGEISFHAQGPFSLVASYLHSSLFNLTFPFSGISLLSALASRFTLVIIF